MNSSRIDIAGIRREQIVEAAIAVVTEKGIQNLSLSEIEKRARMSRGQLTYYFPTKEDILLALFDRMVMLIHEKIGAPGSNNGRQDANSWGWISHLLEKLVAQPPVSPEFACLQYTFLSQVAHREDFRQRLATLYESWRSNLALGLASDLSARGAPDGFSPRAFATLVQAVLHGLGVQRAADPHAFDGVEMLNLCLNVLGTYLWHRPKTRRKRKPSAKLAGTHLIKRVPRLAGQSAAKGVNGVRAHR